MSAPVALADEHARALRDREAEATEENELAERHLHRHRTRLDDLERSILQRVEILGERLRNNRELLAQGPDHEGGRRARTTRPWILPGAICSTCCVAATTSRRTRCAVRTISRPALPRRGHNSWRRTIGVTELSALIESWRILAPVTGRVIEIWTQGAPAPRSNPVSPCSASRPARKTEGLDVLFYVPPVEGKRVEAGMPALVSPATVRREEFGSMTGTVEDISEFPASLDGMIAVLQSRDLALTFSDGGPPYAGRIALTRDASTASGFAWTSPQAAVVSVRPGTLATVEVEVANEPPIALVVPWVKEALGL